VVSAVDSALDHLAHLVRRPAPKSLRPPVMSGMLPDDLQRDGIKGLSLDETERNALENLRAVLPEDLRYEHMSGGTLQEATSRFVAQAWLDPTGEAVAQFVREHAREPLDRVCFFPVEWLTVSEQQHVFGVRLLPLAEVQVPANLFGPEAYVTSGCVVAVEVCGTSHRRMALRARDVAARAVRVLRMTLRGSDRWLADVQLRFRLRPWSWFDDGASVGLGSREGGEDLELDARRLALALAEPAADLPQTPTTDLDHRVERALRWFERAQLAFDPTDELLYLFFALESILGERSDGLKGHSLALRRAMLGLLTTGSFAHPTRTYLLYDEVRSATVHGEDAWAFDEDVLSRFSWDVREAINEYIRFAREHHITERKSMRRALDTSPRRAGVLEGLVSQDPKSWRRFAQRDAERRKRSSSDPAA
jgi:hypothetical protein